jgi:hypothetical protein
MLRCQSSLGRDVTYNITSHAVIASTPGQHRRFIIQTPFNADHKIALLRTEGCSNEKLPAQPYQKAPKIAQS